MKGNIMGNQQPPGSEQKQKNPNTQGTGSPSQDRKSGQMEQDQGGRQNQQGGTQRQDKENERSKSGAQRPD